MGDTKKSKKKTGANKKTAAKKSTTAKKSTAAKKKTPAKKSTALAARKSTALAVKKKATSGTDTIVRSHVLWSMGAGLVPIPLLDIAAVTAIQIDALEKLAEAEGIDYSQDAGKKFVAALTGGTFARIGASLIKGVPVLGSVLGGISMSAMSAASTYAVCQVALKHFREQGNFLKVNVDMEDAKSLYETALKKGKEFVKNLEDDVEADTTRETYENLAKLSDLREAGVLTKKEYESKKDKMLGKL